MLKKFLLIFLLVCTFSLAGEEFNFRKFNVAISLGEVCQSAWALKDSEIRLQSFPLDWNVVPYHGLIKFINDEAEGFLDKDNLIFNDGVWAGAKEARYDIYIAHDFIISLIEGDPEPKKLKTFYEVDVKNYDDVKEKYERRIKRFFDYMRSDKRILFVRTGLNREQAIQLDYLIHSKFPFLDYLIIAVDGTEEIKKDWGLERVRNYYIDRSQSGWVSSKDEWKVILSPYAEQFHYEPLEEDLSDRLLPER